MTHSYRRRAPSLTRNRTFLTAVTFFGAVTGSLVTSRPVAAHAVFTMPVPRVTGMAGSGLTVGPCGGGAAATRTATQASTPLTPGASLQITWNETINHPGCFLVDFSAAGDANFQQIGTLAHNGAGALPRPYSMTVTLPSTPCAACTLRLRQLQMPADPPAGMCPGNGQTQVTYYSCANVVLAGAGGVDAGAPMGTGGVNGTGGAAAAGGRAGGTGGQGTGGAPVTGTGGSVVVAGGTGGQTATGGTTSNTTGTGGAVASAGTGGSTGTPGGTGATGSLPATNPDSGGGCSVMSSGRSSLASVTLALGFLAALTFRRRRARSKGRCARSLPDPQSRD